jgi:hypothetical protein
MKTAIWLLCAGVINDGIGGHMMRDGCSSCAPHWEMYPACPDCNTGLGKGSRKKCPTCNVMVKIEPNELKAVSVEKLKPGDRLDLHSDKYADDGEDSTVLFEYAVVDSVIEETPECILVHFEQHTSVGFPKGHVVRMLRG